MPNHFARQCVTALGLTLAIATAGAQSFPTRPITIVVPFPPGGLTDQTARLVGARVSENIKQTVLVDNRPGGGGQIAATFVKNAPADGHTLFLAGVGTHAINQTLYNQLTYDPIKDFEPITNLIQSQVIVVVPAAHPAKTMADLVAMARANPGKMNYASQSVGSTGHLSGELVRSVNKLDLVHVPYRGSAPALVDMVAGRVEFLFDAVVSSLPFVRDGRLRAIGLSGARRSNLLPSVPTLTEQGHPGYDVATWFGLAAPAGTPRPIIDRLNMEFVRAIRSPDIVQRFADQGVDIVTNSPAEFAAFIRTETERLGKVVKDSGARAD